MSGKEEAKATHADFWVPLGGYLVVVASAAVCLSMGLVWFLAPAVAINALLGWRILACTDGLPAGETRRRARWLSIGQFALVWSFALGAGAFFGAKADGDFWDRAWRFLTIFLLVSSGIGGLFSVIRANFIKVQGEAHHGALKNTSALLATTQAEVVQLHEALDRVNPTGARLAALAVQAYAAEDEQVVTSRLIDMVNVAVRLPETSKFIDSISLWALHPRDRVWFILIDSSGKASNLTEDVLIAETPAGGVVANMAVTGTTFFKVGRGVTGHTWWKLHAASTRKNEGMAAVLLQPRGGPPIGALCVTTERAGEIDDHTDLEDVLRSWGGSFTLALEALLRFRT